jgi:putative acetyltransferase
MVEIDRDDPARADVRQLLDEHLADMFATSPPDSVHALDHSALSASGVTFWTARERGVLLGCGALKELTASEGAIAGGRAGEIKSMRTTPTARGRGIAALLLARIVAEARHRGWETLYLETGSEEFFAPARRLYGRHGFTECPPFADYSLDPHSVFMRLTLPPQSPTPLA